MAKPKLGSGERFSALKEKIAARGGVRNPAAVAASIGRKKFGKERFQELAAAGRRQGGQFGGRIRGPVPEANIAPVARQPAGGGARPMIPTALSARGGPMTPPAGQPVRRAFAEGGRVTRVKRSAPGDPGY